MSIEQLGSIGEFIAAILTILTLGYLALQIRASNRQGVNSARHRFDEEFIRINSLSVTNPEHASLILKLISKERLSDIEQVQAHGFAKWLTNQYRSIETAFFLKQVDQSYYEMQCKDFENLLAGLPGLAPYLRSIVGEFDEAGRETPVILMPAKKAGGSSSDA